MNIQRLAKIKEDVGRSLQIADDILMGDRDNYDGADGARKVSQLCDYCEELIKEVERLAPMADGIH